MTLVRYQPALRRYPLMSMNAFQNRINSLFDEIFHNEEKSDDPRWSPRVDMIEFDDKYEFAIETPGLSKDEISLEIKDNILSISGEKKYVQEKKDRKIHLSERGYGSFYRSFRLPAQTDINNINAQYTDGILRIDLPKAEEAKPKQISIKVS